MIEPAIVVIAFNRVEPLKRLLKSLNNAEYPSNNITLHISIDASNSLEVEKAAQEFSWAHGEKVVELKSENRGLLKHVLECGQLTEKYGSIIVLEDDLIVAPGFYQFAQQSNDFYSSDEKIAGVSLFTYSIEENNFYPFQPIQDDSDVHFIQVASSWGQAWSKDQWSKFKSWLTENQNEKEGLLPEYILKWGNNSWKKLFINYLIDTDRYFVFPNTSYSSNFEEEGTHATNTGLFQVQMNLGGVESRLKKWNESNAIYDVYFELKSASLKKLVPSLSEHDFEVDIYGKKPIASIDGDLILTSKRGRDPIRTFGTEMKPLVQNILFGIDGSEIGLYNKKDLLPTEHNRFLALNTASASLDQKSDDLNQLVEPLLTIIPVPNLLVDDVNITFEHISTNTEKFYNYTILIVCSEESKRKISKTVESAPLKVEFVVSDSQDIDELLRTGIESCPDGFCSWMQPGMKVDLDHVEKVAQIFHGMSQVQILQAVQENVDEHNYAKLNTANYRWTPQTANLYKKEAALVRSEMIFWRASLISEIDTQTLTTANLFLELLKVNPIYVLALKLGDTNGREPFSNLTSEEVPKSLSSPEFQPKFGFRSVLRPIFKFFFQRNVPFFRLFYRDTEQLPMVVRYDFKNDSFYLDNY